MVTLFYLESCIWKYAFSRKKYKEKVVWYQCPKKLHHILIHVAEIFITNTALDVDLCMDISEHQIHSECCYLILLHLALWKLNKNFALVEKFEECSCDALLSAKKLWKRSSKFFIIICFQRVLANTKLVWIILSMKVDMEFKSCKFLK